MEPRLIAAFALIALMFVAGMVALAQLNARRRERRGNLRGRRRRK